MFCNTSRAFRNTKRTIIADISTNCTNCTNVNKNAFFKYADYLALLNMISGVNQALLKCNISV